MLLFSLQYLFQILICSYLYLSLLFWWTDLQGHSIVMLQIYSIDSTAYINLLMSILNFKRNKCHKKHGNNVHLNNANEREWRSCFKSLKTNQNTLLSFIIESPDTTHPDLWSADSYSCAAACDRLQILLLTHS